MDKWIVKYRTGSKEAQFVVEATTSASAIIASDMLVTGNADYECVEAIPYDQMRELEIARRDLRSITFYVVAAILIILLAFDVAIDLYKIADILGFINHAVI